MLWQRPVIFNPEIHRLFFLTLETMVCKYKLAVGMVGNGRQTAVLLEWAPYRP